MREGARFAVLVLGCSALWLPASAAAAPPNDNFANRQVLSGSLPLEASESNEGATSEEGETISPFASGHSVWLEWEATASEWVTVGSCGSDFETAVAIFTGTELGSLTRVVGGSPAEGPSCPTGEREYTFKSVAGTHYVIAVDGSSFTGPGIPPPTGVGTIALRIESTPPPPNDDFADRADLTASGSVYELETGEHFYFARLDGYNWGATKETGEPEHQGDPGGASVWYEWTAPATGSVGMSACCFAAPLLGIYTGDAVGALTEVPTTSEFLPEVRAQVTAGQTYEIAVDGRFDEASGEPTQVSFAVSASMSLQPTEGPGEPQPPAVRPAAVQPAPSPVAPETAITKTQLVAASGSAKFWFSSDQAGGGFLCRLDANPFKPCGSPRPYKHLKPGMHAFRVKAVDAAGIVDASAAVGRFKVPARYSPRER